MARVTPKTNWAASDTPVAPDFNRIEGNAQQAFDELDAEVSARISAVSSEASTRASADSTLQSNINAEASTRASADSTLQSNINSEASTRASADNALDSAKADKPYTGSDQNNTIFPIGTSVICDLNSATNVRNSTIDVYLAGTNAYSNINQGLGILVGTWKLRAAFSTNSYGIVERIS